MRDNEMLFAVNPQAGRGRGAIYGKRIESMFSSWGIKATVVYTLKDGSDSAFSIGKKAAEEGFHTLVGVGGDGTKNLLLNGMMASGVPLESLPRFGLVQAGTGNNFAKNVGMPSSFNEAMEAIRKGNTVLVDVGRVSSGKEKKHFLNVVSFGFDAQVVEKTKVFREKYRFAPSDLTYLLAAGQELFLGLPSYAVSLSAPEFSLNTSVCLLAVLNGPSYGAVFRIAPDADMSDGLFDVCLVKDKISKIKALEILFRATKGKHVGLPQVKHLRVSCLTVSSEKILPCEVDGEVALPDSSYEISVLPRALRVIVPPFLVPSQRPLKRSEVNAPECQYA